MSGWTAQQYIYIYIYSFPRVVISKQTVGIMYYDDDDETRTVSITSKLTIVQVDLVNKVYWKKMWMDFTVCTVMGWKIWDWATTKSKIPPHPEIYPKSLCAQRRVVPIVFIIIFCIRNPVYMYRFSVICSSGERVKIWRITRSRKTLLTSLII